MEDTKKNNSLLMSNAFKYIFKDNNWKYKFTILALLEFPYWYFVYSIQLQKDSLGMPNKIALLILGLITIPFAIGYVAKSTRNIMSSLDESNILADWEDNFLNYFLIGVKMLLAVLVSYIIFLIPIFIAAFIMTFYASKNIPLIISLALLSISPLLIFNIIFLALYKNFCSEFNLKAFFDWKDAKRIIWANPKRYLMAFAIPAAFSTLMGIAMGPVLMLTQSTLVLSIFSTIYLTYSMLLSVYLIGNIDKKITSE